jgi:hypothetical protein
VGKGALAPRPPAESKRPITPIGFGGHGAKSAFAHPTDFDLNPERALVPIKKRTSTGSD